VDDRILNAKPRKADDPIVTQALLLRAVTSAALIVCLTLGVFFNELETLVDGAGTTIGTVAVTRRATTMTFMTFVNCDLFNAYVCRSAEKCFYEMNPTGNPAFVWAVGGSIVGQLFVTYFPPLQEVFQTEALSLKDLGTILLLGSGVLWLDTLRKKFFRRWFIDGFHASSPVSKKEDDPVASLAVQQQQGRGSNGNGNGWWSLSAEANNEAVAALCSTKPSGSSRLNFRKHGAGAGPKKRAGSIMAL